MCSQQVKKIFQQTFIYDGTGTFHSVNHHFNRVYKSKPEQFFKIKPIYISTTEPLVMRNFSQINSLCNYDETNGNKIIASSNKFFLGSSSSNLSIEMMVDEIDINDFTISYENGTTLDKYTIVFQIELFE
jgi:uncharacterized protein involved in tellurium resistance